MNTTVKLGLALLVLIGATFGIYQYQQAEDPMQNVGYDRDFKVKDVSKIHKIFLVNRRQGLETTLERNGQGWTYNEKYKANQNVMESLLDAISEIEIKYVPNKNAKPVILKDLATNSIKVEIYGKNDKLIKSYYLGSATNDNYGTHAIMEDSNNPMVVHSPTFYGIIFGRFDKQPREWRSRIFIEEDPSDITAVRIDYPKQQQNAFSLAVNNGNYTVEPIYPGIPKIDRPPFDRIVKNYLEGFARVACEGYEEPKPFLDSLLRDGIPFADFTFERKDDSQFNIKLYPMPKQDETGQITGTDDLRYLGIINGGDENVLVQRALIGPLLRGYSYFFPDEQ